MDNFNDYYLLHVIGNNVILRPMNQCFEAFARE